MQTTEQNTPEEGRISVKEISLPKGGGAIKGLGNSFEANLFTGAGTYTIPIALTPARGFEPQLSLNYSSGSGNGSFGLGFSLSLSKISINTNLRIPKYLGNDVFELDGEQLVVQTSSKQIPNPRQDSYQNQNYTVTLYLPRVQGNYMQIEYWQNNQTQSGFWKTISTTNTVSYYGITTQIANPANALQVFEWLIDQSTDNKGNEIVYNYVAENNVNVPLSVYELNRIVTANRYISSIQYGNYKDDTGKTLYAFEVLFNYGESDFGNTQATWLCRPDPFSVYNSGFEIRTYRLCQKIQMVHNFPNEIGQPLIVKELALTYNNAQQYAPVQYQSMSLLVKALLTGYRQELANGQSLPPVEFGYSLFAPPAAPEFKQLNMGNGGTIPGYLNATQFLPVDLNGEGLPGFVVSNKDYSFYLEPLGNGNYNLPLVNTPFPVNKNLTDEVATLVDIDGNGQLELLVNMGNSSGYYEREVATGWKNFVAFENYPNNISEPGTEMVDLSADGRNDLLLAGTDTISVYPSAGKTGYDTIQNIPNEVNFPLVKQNYKQELVSFANMFGDGLSHRVKISSGSVECWPCLGYGHFGEKITFANPPLFEGNFDTDRIFLADVDGSGTVDLIYVYPNRVELFMNQSGNSFSDAIVVYLPELYSSLDQISFSDILGNGTACLVFTKMKTEPVHYYYNFSGETKLPDGTLKQSLKPYLLNFINSNMGGLSYINYSSSTKFLLEDKQAGNQWFTKLPFPVQVVEELIQYDIFSKSRYVSTYKYHSGYYDSEEKQFKGFGFVESWDSETYENFEQNYSNPDYPVAALNKQLYVPPVYTKSWYLTGAGFKEYDLLLQNYKKQFFNQDTAACDFPDSQFSSDIYNNNSKTLSEAFKALSSQLIRKEVYANDESSLSALPYSVEQLNYEVILTQVATDREYGVYAVNPQQTINYYYERNINDPRVEQSFVLQTDNLNGLALQTCKVYLPRRNSQTSNYTEQHVLKATLDTNAYYNSPPTDFTIRLRGIDYQQQTYTLLGLTNPLTGYYSFDEINTQVQNALKNITPYSTMPDDELPTTLQAQQTSIQCNYYWDTKNGLVTNVLSLGEVSPQALLHHNSVAEFNNDNINTMFGQRLTQDAITQLGGYNFDNTTNYWMNDGLIQDYYNANAFYMPSGVQSSSADVGTLDKISYDSYNLMAVSLTNYISQNPDVTNTISLLNDYQAMAPKQLADANGTVSQVLFDALGQVIVTTLFGVENGMPVGGMLLYDYAGQAAQYIYRNNLPDFYSICTDAATKAFYLQGALSYFYYNLNINSAANQPVCSVNLQAQNYYTNPVSPYVFACNTLIAYNDGFGRSLAQKTEGEQSASGNQWLTSGRTVYNNKGKNCENYLPYFSNTPYFESQDEITAKYTVPPPTITQYDPLLRVIQIDTPKGFFSKVEFTPWQQLNYDEDDTVKDSIYYTNFMANYPATPTQAQQDEYNALQMAAGFYNTPTTLVLDNMGYTIRSIQILINAQGTSELTTFYAVDINGRKIIEIDPRLYQSNLSDGTAYYNFKYQYSMGNEQPIVTDSADAGIQKHFSNILDQQVWSLSPRDYCQIVYYDWLKRKTQLLVKKVPGTDPINYTDNFNLVEVYTYGETAGLPTNCNLRGQLYELKDLSGIFTNNSYSIAAKVLQNSRQMASVYKTAVNWNNPVALDNEIYSKKFGYNALGQMLSESTIDNLITVSTITKTFNNRGLLSSISLAASTNADIITNISYNANQQRSSVVYGNGVTTNYTYEESTLRLTGLVSQTNNTSPSVIKQNIVYTYDPVGNVTCTRDSSIEIVFYNNQKIEPALLYSYDSLYRLVQSGGRQKIGITATTYQNNIADNDFMQSKFSQTPLSDAQAIENYFEKYFYDNSDNLIQKAHSAQSGSWTINTPALPNNNQLQNLQYDSSGNQRQLIINSAVQLKYNCCENLVAACNIQRPNEANDSDYYVYDSVEMRSRKVSELYLNSSFCNYYDTVYFSNYQVLRKGTQSLADGTRTITYNQQTTRVMDGDSCVAVLYHWLQGSPDGSDGPAPDQLRYQLDNNLGSVTTELDENAALVSYEEYFAYGGTSFIAGPNQVDVSLKTYRYSGKECDNSTGLYYYGMRYYVSWLGRWLKPDPAGTIDGLNLYRFVRSNPIKLIDKKGLFGSANKYEWLVTSSTAFVSPDADINKVLENFGHPVSSVVKAYDDLASRVGYDVSHGGVLSSTTVADLQLAFDASLPLHYGFNDFLGDEWRSNMGSYAGSKRRIPLYSVMRSKTTDQFKSESSVPGYANFNDVLYAVSDRPAEVHHILYKAVRPKYANQTSNLMLVERSPKESVYGPGQHELMHMLGSGNDSNKFSVLLTQFEDEYIKWYKAKKTVVTMQVSMIE